MRLGLPSLEECAKPDASGRSGVKCGVPCFYRVAGIYSLFALEAVERMGGRKPTFLLVPDGVDAIPA